MILSSLSYFSPLLISYSYLPYIYFSLSSLFPISFNISPKFTHSLHFSPSFPLFPRETLATPSVFFPSLNFSSSFILLFLFASTPFPLLQLSPCFHLFYLNLSFSSLSKILIFSASLYFFFSFFSPLAFFLSPSLFLSVFFLFLSFFLSNFFNLSFFSYFSQPFLVSQSGLRIIKTFFLHH